MYVYFNVSQVFGTVKAHAACEMWTCIELSVAQAYSHVVTGKLRTLNNL